MKPISIRDVIGPVMIGPSSSHTAGALRIALMCRSIMSTQPVYVVFKLYGSFAHTYEGHGTDRALVAGMLGFSPDDERVRDSFSHAKSAGMSFEFEPIYDNAAALHPNTVCIEATDACGAHMSLRGESIGGGAAVISRIDGIDVHMSGEFHSIVVKQLDRPGVLAHIANTLSACQINIATTRMYRKKRGETAYTIMETDDEIPRSIAELLTRNDDILDVRIIRSDAAEAQHAGAEATCADPEQAQAVFEQLDYQNAAAMLAACEKQHMNLAQAMYAREDALCAVQGRDAAATRRYLQHALDVMRRSATRPIEAPVSSMGGLIGGEAHLLAALEQTDTAPVSGLLARACTYAAAVLETNASMGCIVAAPTAGASGVLPAVLLACQDERGYTDDELVDALACAAAIGYIATRNATVAGAQGGCQAEVGTASAMAAAACAQLSGATPAQCFAAASNALCGMMGLVCDPIAGLVEAPCQKRNVHGAANALVSAHMACAGIQNIVNFDETLEAARRVGESLPHELRETALGGLAATPSACAWCETYRTTRHAAAFGRDGAGI